MTPGTPVAYFDAIYAGGPDPWGSQRWYERRKRALLLAALPEERYRTAIEPGCGPGLLTVALAARCARVFAVERSPVAAAAARDAVAGLPHVQVSIGTVPQDWPDVTADLVVLSEMGYYTSSTGWSTLLDRALAGLAPGGTVAAVHWRHPADDHANSGDTVHTVLRARDDLAAVASYLDADFRLDVLRHERRGTRGLSVAARTGVQGVVP